MADKVRLRIIGLTYSQTQTGSYALVLAEEEGQRRIPIMIGAFEAQAIAVHLEGLEPPRPLTHDLFLSFSEAFAVTLKEVFISKLEEGIFYAELAFFNGTDIITIDSRTSDAVALALRFKCPIYTTPEIIEKSGIILEDQKDEDEEIILADDPSDSGELRDLELDELNQLLEEAVGNEDYELASEIRDEIKRREKNHP